MTSIFTISYDFLSIDSLVEVEDSVSNHHASYGFWNRSPFEVIWALWGNDQCHVEAYLSYEVWDTMQTFGISDHMNGKYFGPI